MNLADAGNMGGSTDMMDEEVSAQSQWLGLMDCIKLWD